MAIQRWRIDLRCKHSRSGAGVPFAAGHGRPLPRRTPVELRFSLPQDGPQCRGLFSAGSPDDCSDCGRPDTLPRKVRYISDVPLAPRKVEMNVHFTLTTICTPKRCMVFLFSSENNCILKEVLL